ncbi:hypothetical protein COEREDRAFT_86019 [Coemansia reversa NRRL 1564]|uniref:HMG box domain-containing protein n=1 Tax=Coemansia reversa (strain ATCC 12441 / NRRL 1564) TaxID=763665 RepID=A0A2G5BFI0_COERN|nr:hypothetical protein COEREDRAFT_86019 [Coemansia reversa NRRL 1564]|eukprot:PIA17760.1 hypothetical protein COEREDRAFT_86019 [Coemansia reversa NRRL 1564]
MYSINNLFCTNVNNKEHDISRPVLPLPRIQSRTEMMLNPIRPTSHIFGESQCKAYQCSINNDITRLPVSQIHGPDGKLYIEHIPGYNLVYLPKSIPIDRPLQIINQAQSKWNNDIFQSTEKPTKPHNAFIKYRSSRLKEIKRLHPGSSQIDLSRIAADYWKIESPTTKKYFQDQYREELEIYHQKQKIHHMAVEHHNKSKPTLTHSSYNYTNNISPTTAGLRLPRINTLDNIDFSVSGSPSDFNAKRRRSRSLPPVNSIDMYPAKRLHR